MHCHRALLPARPSHCDGGRSDNAAVWLMATAAAGGAVAAVATAIPFVSTFAPSERARAAGGPVEVDISDLPPGAIKTVEWRGKPVWVMRRTPEMLAALQGHDADLAGSRIHEAVPAAGLRHATSARSIRPEVFVAVGICTHLGCSPNEVASKVPAIRACLPIGLAAFSAPATARPSTVPGGCSSNKPAPTNLEIPPHRLRQRHAPAHRRRRRSLNARTEPCGTLPGCWVSDSPCCSQS
jgi:ubiquinol-cytochrome c reductase iron-sulfur subunit